MTDRRPQDLVALVGSRIAHDLISPLGAIGNGIELLGLTGLDGTPELTLIAESVDNANARIRFFRIAFGAARAGQVVAEDEIRALLAPGVDGRKLDIDWQPVGDVARRPAKLAFLALMCFETAMPWGGRVAVTDTGVGWRLVGSAERFKLDADLWALLSGPDPTAELAPAQVHFALLAHEAAAQVRALQITWTAAAITIDF